MDELPLVPVSSWTLGNIKEHGVIILSFEFLAHSMQSPEEARESRTYAFPAHLARELIFGIEKQLRALEAAGPQGSPPGRTQ